MSHHLSGFVAAVAAAVLVPFASLAAEVAGQGTWEASLQGRDLDGNLQNGFEAYYDVALGITWLADANHAVSSGFVAGGDGSAGYWANGNMTWPVASTWAASVSVHGVSGWRLPALTDLGAVGCEGQDFSASGTDCGYNVGTSTSELAHMYYVTLGNKSPVTTAGAAQSGFGFLNTGPFEMPAIGTPYSLAGAQTWGFWSGTAGTAQQAFFLATYYGEQRLVSVSDSGVGVWLVRDGDVAPVPEPGSLALLLAGVAVVGSVVHRRKTVLI
jgi:hypothetical protein